MSWMQSHAKVKLDEDQVTKQNCIKIKSHKLKVWWRPTYRKTNYWPNGYKLMEIQIMGRQSYGQFSMVYMYYTMEYDVLM